MSNIPKRNLASGRHLLKKLINPHGGLLDVTTNIYLKSCAYHPDSECCTFFHGNLSDPKSSEDTLLYLYVIWNMSKSSDLHKTILTPVICHKHVRCHDGVTLYFSEKFPSVAQRKRDMDIFHICQEISAFWSKNKKKNKKKTEENLKLNARKHWESESINRNLSAAVIHVNPVATIVIWTT